jgi:hypothetical protein
MIDILDSRALGRTDCYGQRFMKAGTFRYNVLPVGGQSVTDERPFAVEVREAGKGEMKQHNVAVRFEGGRFRAAQDEVVIDAGDVVLWNCPDNASVPYVIAGDKEFFASDRMVNECGYSHAFGFPGEYRWVDAHGGRAAGIVRVKDPACKDAADFQRWRKQLAKGNVVMIQGGRAAPREVEILTGQTVFFAVVKGSGMSITDERLLKEVKPRPRPGRPPKAEKRSASQAKRRKR